MIPTASTTEILTPVADNVTTSTGSITSKRRRITSRHQATPDHKSEAYDVDIQPQPESSAVESEPSAVDPESSEVDPEFELDTSHKDIHTFRIKVVIPKPEKKDTRPPYSNLDDHIEAIETGSHMELDDSIQMNDAYPDTHNTISKVYNCPDKSNDPDSRKTYFKAVENQVKKDIEVLTSMIKNPEKPIKYNKSSQSNPSNVELSDNISDMLMRSETLKRIITSEVT
ncbi:unnamed protein product [Ambrosiozyma monospora]|uniref:Unnamed protein product n=1 Tax=Ambrosiozyma monospora TaxID=43982 RepID=A0A9W6YYV1_AMBMO|nr:unnamed protein product [Ambrosiozyma monospora]